MVRSWRAGASIVTCPALTSTTLISNYLGRPVRVQVRTHWIKVYPGLQAP